MSPSHYTSPSAVTTSIGSPGVIMGWAQQVGSPYSKRGGLTLLSAQGRVLDMATEILSAVRLEALLAIAGFAVERDRNRDRDGNIVNLSLDRRLQAKERQVVVAALGMTPEGSTPGDRYVADTMEMIGWLKESVK